MEEAAPGTNEIATAEAVRARIWSALRRVARPDSRFHWDFSAFNPDFEGSESCADRIRALPPWQASRLMFITPDGGLEYVRRQAMADGKAFVMSTGALARDFLYLPAGAVPTRHHEWAATLDGMERFATPCTLLQVAALGVFDVLITQSLAISIQGVRFGKGHGYFDLEWALFSEIGCLSDDPLVVTVGHDCQVVDMELAASETDARADLLVTPTRTIPVPAGMGHRAGRIIWERLQPDMEDRIPAIRELRGLRQSR